MPDYLLYVIYMRKLREIAGYVLGGLMFVLLIPALMLLVTYGWELPSASQVCMSASPLSARFVVAVVMVLLGLSLSVWSIVYMRRKGDGNPMDAFGHEVAPRTRHLMTDGPYRLSRNPMLTGSFIYNAGVCILLASWQAWIVFIVFVVVMLLQVRSEEKRLRRDFGDEYEAYCRRTGRFWPWRLLLLAGLLVSLGSCSTLLPSNNKENKKNMKTERLVYFYYDHHNSMAESGERYDVKTLDDGTVRLLINEHTSKEKTIILDDATIFDDLQAIVKNYKMDKYKRDYNPMFDIYDGDSWSLHYSYDSGRSVSSGGYMAWPSNYHEMRNALSAYFSKWQ